MPLLKGKSRRVLEQNFHELRHGKTFAHTMQKFGKKAAMRQMIAIVLHTKRNAKKRTKGRRSK